MSKWLIGSQHSKFDSELQEKNFEESEWEEKLGNETLYGLNIEDRGKAYLALRYEKKEADGISWITEIIYEELIDSSNISIQVFSESDKTKLSLPPARKPYIVRQLISEIGGGVDGSLQVSDQPLFLNNLDIDFAADLINGNCENRLPIVYISATNRDETPVSAAQLARWLSGVGHVVVEPNREFSFRLMNEVNHQNAYGGAVAIHWPDRSSKELLLPARFDFDAKSLSIEVSKLIRNRAIRLRRPRSLTWAYLKEIRAKQEIEKLRQGGSSDLQAYIDNFDQEISAKDQALEEAEADIRRLEAEIYNLRSRTQHVEGEPILVRGNEPDLYENEALEILVDAIEKGLSNCVEGSRRWDVLQSLKSANEATSNKEELAANVKAILSNYRKLEGSIEHDLEELGFEISGEGKHYRLVFKGDTRYSMSMPKTSSDHRAGKNLVSQINNNLF
ncbi:hypothetical protein LG325_09340 [Marinobacter nauticus]